MQPIFFIGSCCEVTTAHQSQRRDKGCLAEKNIGDIFKDVRIGQFIPKEPYGL